MPNVEKRDYYEVLGVEQSASESEVKAAYRRLALEFHPDKNPGDARAEERFKEASEAYAVLSDPDKRARYDRFGHGGVSDGAGFTDIRDIFGAFGDVFGGGIFETIFGGGAGRGRGPARGRDIAVEHMVSFDAMAQGGEQQLEFRRPVACDSCEGVGSADGRPPVTCPGCAGQGYVRSTQGFFSVQRACPRCQSAGVVVEQPCRACGGQGQRLGRREFPLEIPPGIFDGVVMRVPGEGEPGPHGGPPGDLKVHVRIGEHPLFVRSPEEPADLYVQASVPLSTAVLGGEIEVPTLDGTRTLSIPSGTAPGQTIRVRNEGLPRFQARGRGDLHVRVEYDVPTSPSRKLRKALEDVGRIEKGEPAPRRRRYEDALKQHRKSVEKRKRRN